MFKKLSRFWNEHGFNVLVITTILFFSLYWLFVTRHRKNGTYATSYYYNPDSPPLARESFYDPQRRHPSSKHAYHPRAGEGSWGKKRRITQTSKGEEICRRYLEHVFERPFQKCRPPFLYNTVTSENLELDVYNPDINLAVEYHGRQHYEYVPFMHNHSRINFHNQKYRDEKKIELCRRNGVPLIVVPYTVPHDRIPGFLRKEIGRLGIQGVQRW